MTKMSRVTLEKHKTIILGGLTAFLETREDSTAQQFSVRPSISRPTLLETPSGSAEIVIFDVE